MCLLVSSRLFGDYLDKSISRLSRIRTYEYWPLQCVIVAEDECGK